MLNTHPQPRNTNTSSLPFFPFNVFFLFDSKEFVRLAVYQKAVRVPLPPSFSNRQTCSLYRKCTTIVSHGLINEILMINYTTKGLLIWLLLGPTASRSHSRALKSLTSSDGRWLWLGFGKPYLAHGPREWHSWHSGRFRYQRSAVRIPASAMKYF